MTGSHSELHTPKTETKTIDRLPYIAPELVELGAVGSFVRNGPGPGCDQGGPGTTTGMS
jgi:hypothetical protein